MRSFINCSVINTVLSLGIIYSFKQWFRRTWKAGGSQIGLNAAQNAWHNNPKRESCERREKNEWNPVPWLSVCAPTVHEKVREAGMAERWRWRRKRGRLFIVKWGGSLRCRWQTIQAAAVEKRWGSEWHQAAGVNIIKQNAVNAELCMTECSSEMRGYTTCLLERSAFKGHEPAETKGSHHVIYFSIRVNNTGRMRMNS